MTEAVTPEELANDEEYTDILEDMREECGKARAPALSGQQRGSILRAHAGISILGMSWRTWERSAARHAHLLSHAWDLCFLIGTSEGLPAL